MFRHYRQGDSQGMQAVAFSGAISFETNPDGHVGTHPLRWRSKGGVHEVQVAVVF
jgi:hypothetical protein